MSFDQIIEPPFEIPFKLRVLTGITDALKEITPGNGYVYNMADFDPGDGSPQARVFRGRAWFGENDPLPLISVLEGTAPGDEVSEPPADQAVAEYDWPLLVQGFVQDDPANPTDPAYVLMADVRRRLALETKRKASGTQQPDPFGLGITGKNKILSLGVGAGVARPADDVSAKAYFWLSIVVRVTDNAEHPYA